MIELIHNKYGIVPLYSHVISLDIHACTCIRFQVIQGYPIETTNSSQNGRVSLLLLALVNSVGVTLELMRSDNEKRRSQQISLQQNLFLFSGPPPFHPFPLPQERKKETALIF